MILTLAPGDFNLNGREVGEQIAPRKRARVHPAKDWGGTAVDNLLTYGRAELILVDNLGRMGSDAHDAMLWCLRAGVHDLFVVSWNVYVGNTPEHVKVGMNRLHRKDVDVIALQEVNAGVLSMLHAWAPLNGFWIQAGPVEGGACVVLVAHRPDRVLLRRNLLKMRVPWVGPKMDIPKKPRVFPVIKVREGDLVIRATSLHGPTGGINGPNAKAVNEFCRKVRRWVRRAG